MKDLKQFIDFLVEKKLKLVLEKTEDNKDSGAEAPTPDTELDVGSDEGGGLEDLAGDENNASSALDAALDGDGGEDAGGDASDAPGDFEKSSGGGFGGGSFGSGNVSFDDEISDDTGEKDNKEDGSEAKIIKVSTDPIQAIIDIASELRTKSGDAQQILNTVKSSIQNNFENFDEALDVVELLWNTNDQILQQVAIKLILFIKGE